jgi:uncharacterized protein (DUF2252 family)
MKMMSSAHAYVRGSTARFYEWLVSARGKSLPRAPAIWISGDCHLGNLGALARVDGKIELQMRDLDQTVIGSPAHDVTRLALSMAMAIRASGLPGRLTLLAVEKIAQGYESALEARASRRPVAPLGAPDEVAKLLRLAGHRSRKDLLNERIGGSKAQLIPIGTKFWPLTDPERRAVEALAEKAKFRALVTSLASREDDAPVALLDAAYWVKGCSSLGLWRCAALVSVGREKKAVRALVDLKEAPRPAAPSAPRVQIPADGDRVVHGARALAPHLGSRIISARVLDVPVTVRELLPQDLKFELDALAADDVEELATHLGSVVGIAHARQLTPPRSAAWLEAFRREPTPGSTAPSWLWAAVVDLVALHEGAYLEHCRENRRVMQGVSFAAEEASIVSHHVHASGDPTADLR